MVNDTKELIKFFPFEPSFKQMLLEKCDELTGEAKFEFDNIIWDAYYQVYQAQLKQNIEVALEKGTETLDNHFYKKIREKTEKEMDEMIQSESQTSDLSAARSAMEKIIKEIQAAKKS